MDFLFQYYKLMGMLKLWFFVIFAYLVICVCLEINSFDNDEVGVILLKK
jgi:hypothetical protein